MEACAITPIDASCLTAEDFSMHQEGDMPLLLQGKVVTENYSGITYSRELCQKLCYEQVQ